MSCKQKVWPFSKSYPHVQPQDEMKCKCISSIVSALLCVVSMHSNQKLCLCLNPKHELSQICTAQTSCMHHCKHCSGSSKLKIHDVKRTACRELNMQHQQHCTLSQQSVQTTRLLDDTSPVQSMGIAQSPCALCSKCSSFTCRRSCCKAGRSTSAGCSRAWGYRICSRRVGPGAATGVWGTNITCTVACSGCTSLV